MFRSNSGGRAASSRGHGSEQSTSNATPAQMIQSAQTTSRPRPIHIPPRHPLNETPDETEPSYSYEEKNFYLPYDNKEEVADEFHKRFAASSSGYHGGRTGRGGSLGSSSFSNAANDNNHLVTGSSDSPSLLTTALSATQDGNGGSSGGSNFWRTTSRQPGSGGKNTRSTSDGSSKDSRSHLPNKNNKSVNSGNRNGTFRGRRRLRSSGQSTKQIDSDSNIGREEYEGGTYNNRVKSKDRNQIQSSGESYGALRQEGGNKINGPHQKGPSALLHQHHHSNPKFPHSNSATSLGSTGSVNNNDKRMKSKQRDAVRRLKLDAQQQLGEDGGIVDNGYYTEVPTIGMKLSDSISKRTRESSDYDIAMSALEEESVDFDTTDENNHNPTDNATGDGSQSFLHSKMETARRNQIGIGVTSSISNGNIVNNSIPQSALLASAAGAAATALSEYHHSKRINNKISDDNAISSLTHHINNLRPSTPPFHQQQPVLPILLNDTTDNRSTTSTMSDLSMTDINTNRHQLSSPTSGKKSSRSSLNSLLNGKPVPIDSPTLSSRENSHFHHQRFPNAVNSDNGATSDITPTMDRNMGSSGTNGIESSRNISNNLSGLGIRNTSKNHEDGNASAPSDNSGQVRRVQTPEIHRHAVGRNGDSNTRRPSTDNSQLANKIALLLDACEQVRFPFKKKLMLNSFQMTAADIPVKDLYGTVLGQSLHKISLSGNRLSTIPRKLVTCLTSLKNMDISQCELHQLPERWNLPQLRRLNLSHNRLSDFPEETMLEGLPELQVLNMFGNKVSAILIPHNPKLLARLETLDLGYNDLADLPDELDRLKSLKILKVMNNFLEKIPMRVCNMELKAIDVSNNPVITPPIETCERGIGSMKRYYHCLTMEEQSKPNALEALQTKARIAKQQKSKKVVGGLRSFSKPKRRMQVSAGRIHSDESSQSSNSKSKSQKSISSVLNQDQRSIVSDTKASTILSVDSDSHPSMSGTPQRSKSLQLNNLSSRHKIDQDRSINNVLDANMESISSFADNSDNEVTINETLKVIFVGMAMAGKTSMIKRLIEGEGAVIPKKDQRTIGVDIYEWDPTVDKRYEHIDNRIRLQDPELENLCPNANVKFSVWDFAGQHVYHATHELFFSPRALYVLVWDMGAKNLATKQRARNKEESRTDQLGAFNLGYDSDASESDNDDFLGEEEGRRADLALERDIDEKVQFWVDCIQSSVPGAAILPVATFNDLLREDDHYEAKRRCDILKERLLKHEARRIQGIKDRLKEYVVQNRANDAPALRLRKLLGSYTRPKIIFGNEGEDSVVRVSGTQYTGFAKLTEKITNIATGRDTAKSRYPIFRGHVGARIPRMRLKVLDAVRSMRYRFKVVEWGYFFQQLEMQGITDVENVSDALHFLTNIGELLYFGDVLPDRSQQNRIVPKEKFNSNGFSNTSQYASDDEGVDDDEIGDKSRASLNATNTTTVSTSEDGSILTHDDQISGGLSQFVFLNPRWLVAAVACILRHDLDREIQYTRRSLAVQAYSSMGSNSFNEANMNCPVITSEDACMLWQAKKLTRKAAERAEENSAGIKLKPFEFLQLLLVRFRVFIPIDLGIERAFLGGREYSRKSMDMPLQQKPEVIQLDHKSGPSGENIVDSLKSTYFFLPSLLGPGEPTEAWTYKSTDSWKATLCHSILFPDGVPPGLMERITATVLSNLYAMAHKQDTGVSESWHNANSNGDKSHLSYEGNISVKEILCWRNTFLVKLGMQVQSPNGEYKESVVDIFTALVDKDSNYCVGSDQMSVGSRCLVTSGKGQEGDGGRKIWMGGYLVVLEAVNSVMEEYGGLEFERQGFCPECLAKKSVSEAHCWTREFVDRAIEKGDSKIRCRHGHTVDIRLICPNYFLNNKDNPNRNPKPDPEPHPDPVVPISDLFRSVVVVGLWDGNTGKIVRVGSGFIADKKRGLIVTASHTLMNIWGEKGTPFGENYYGLPQGKVVIGIIDRKKGGEKSGTQAIIRYFAKIVVKDPKIEDGICHIDACILQITTRMEQDVGGNGEGCGDQIEHLLLNNPHALKQEKLQQLKITDKCEYDEWVKIIGYNQGGEGLMGPGMILNFSVDFARGYVCKKFAVVESNINDHERQPVRHRFKPREEIVVNCDTIVGHSGGPCVNQQGEVIGILSRADPAENKRCYLVPTEEWKPLLKQAKRTL